MEKDNLMEPKAIVPFIGDKNDNNLDGENISSLQMHIDKQQKMKQIYECLLKILTKMIKIERSIHVTNMLIKVMRLKIKTNNLKVKALRRIFAKKRRLAWADDFKLSEDEDSTPPKNRRLSN